MLDEQRQDAVLVALQQLDALRAPTRAIQTYVSAMPPLALARRCYTYRTEPGGAGAVCGPTYSSVATRSIRLWKRSPILPPTIAARA